MPSGQFPEGREITLPKRVGSAEASGEQRGQAIGKKAIKSSQMLCWKSQAASDKSRSLATGLTLKGRR